MKINIRNNSLHHYNRPWFYNGIKDYYQAFSDNYDIQLNEVKACVLVDEAVREEFCNFLRNTRILNMTPYYLKNSNGENIAEGFEVDEDALYTAFVIKYS